MAGWLDEMAKSLLACQCIHDDACINLDFGMQAPVLAVNVSPLESNWKQASCPAELWFSYISCLLQLPCSVLSCLVFSKAYVCTAPTATPCAVAEGLSSFDVPISRLPLITNHPIFISYKERVYEERGTSFTLLVDPPHHAKLIAFHTISFSFSFSFSPYHQPFVKPSTDKPLLLSSLDFDQPTLLIYAISTPSRHSLK